jgi:hypothetical protein
MIICNVVLNHQSVWGPRCVLYNSDISAVERQRIGQECSIYRYGSNV